MCGGLHAFPFFFSISLFFTSELGKVSHFSPRLFVSSNLWETGGGGDLGLVFFFFSVKLSVFWVFGFSIPCCIVCKVIFGFLFLVLVLYRVVLMRFGREGVARRMKEFSLFYCRFFLLVGMKDEGCWVL